MKRLLIVLLALGITLVFVVPGMTASVGLSWDKPVFNCDGSNLDDLSGYVIMWGTSSGGPYSNQHIVDNAGATSATIDVGAIENVSLFFVIVSVDTVGNRSDGPGGCGHSAEMVIPFPMVPPSPPTGVAGAAIP